MHVESELVSAQIAAAGLAELLESQKSDKIVFAESCTSGLIAALMGQSPGISAWMCGSAVTYRESAKQEWIDVSAATLKQKTAESIETTSEMALGVLAKTTEANWSAAVTGHLGPGAPPEIDGLIHICIAKKRHGVPRVIAHSTTTLQSNTRVKRQYESARLVLELLKTQMVLN